MNMVYSLLTGYLNVFTNLFSLLDFSSGCFQKGHHPKSHSKESHCIINVLSKHFPRLDHLVETWLITFLISLLLKFINSLSCFFSFCPPAKVI